MMREQVIGNFRAQPLSSGRAGKLQSQTRGRPTQRGIEAYKPCRRTDFALDLVCAGEVDCVVCLEAKPLRQIARDADQIRIDRHLDEAVPIRFEFVLANFPNGITDRSWCDSKEL